MHSKQRWRHGKSKGFGDPAWGSHSPFLALENWELTGITCPPILDNMVRTEPAAHSSFRGRTFPRISCAAGDGGMGVSHRIMAAWKEQLVRVEAS